MKKLIFLLATFFCVSAMAFTTQKPVDCFGTPEVTKMLREEFNEVIIFDSINNLTGKSRIALFVNSKTGTWTLVEYDNDNACILGAGQSRST
jgi:hypothetical protein